MDRLCSLTLGVICVQGPALYAYNDAVFSPDDWRGLRTLCDSIKAKDPMKVGRFGLGFKSVFHMTGTVNDFSNTIRLIIWWSIKCT